ncbi:MAG: nucleotidyltransferase domain-containing protein [Candidatus Korarchaeota archaeon]
MREIYKRKKRYFEEVDCFLLEIKKIVREKFPDAEVFLFGSVVEGNYSIGLSDIDVAIVSDVFQNRELELDLYEKLTERFLDSPFEFHLLTKKIWEYYKRFIKKYRSI